jgi:hypothetical protein
MKAMRPLKRIKVVAQMRAVSKSIFCFEVIRKRVRVR